MTSQEFSKLMAVLNASYNNFDISDKTKMKIWLEALKDLDYIVCSKAIKKLVLTSEFPPSIASIRKESSTLLLGERKTSADFVSLIIKSISKFGMYNPTAAMEWIKEQDETAYNVIEANGYSNICKSNFDFSKPLLVKMYDEISNNDLKINMLPIKFQKEISSIKQSALPILEDDIE